MNIERLESREVPTGINLEAGVVNIQGSSYNDVVTVSDLGKVKGIDTLKIDMTCPNQIPFSLNVALSEITSINFHGWAGNDTFNIASSLTVPVNAWGGTQDDTLNGAAGNDYLNGEAGVDILNGGAGVNTLIQGGSGPTVATAASASPSTVTGTITSLSVLGADVDSGESSLIYTWTATGIPSGAATPSFSVNGTNAAKNSTATFYAAGSYTFKATITDPTGLTASSSKTVTVTQTLTSLALTPASLTLAPSATQQFTATAQDQFAKPMATQPVFTWTLTGIGTLNSAGLYTAPVSTGTATAKVTAGTLNKTAAVTVSGSSNTAPTVATAANASPSTVTGTTTSLSVLGADNTGETSLTYTWTLTSVPAGAATPTFSANGTNAAKITTATFYAAGSYTFKATITDPAGLTATSSKTVTVSQTLTSLALTPSTVTLSTAATQQFTATAQDQFAKPMTTQPAFTWTLTGSGTLSTAGKYTAPASAGTATVKVSAGTLSKTAAVTVTAVSTTPGIFFDSTTGVITIRGNAYNNNALVQVYTLNGVQLALVTLSLYDSSSVLIQSFSQQYTLSQVSSIYFDGRAGFNTIFRNATAVSCTAYGGTGSNQLTGGSGNDYLYAGASPAGYNNTLQGMGGDDTLVGGSGTNYLYGGTGNDTLIAGTGATYFFPD